MKHKIIKTGRYIKNDKVFDIDNNTLDHWVSTFKEWRDNGHEVYLKSGHTKDPLSSVGKVVNLFKEEDSLVAEFACEQDIKYCSVSIESPSEYLDGTGKKWLNPLVGVALTLNPVVPGLGDFYFEQESVFDKVKKFIGFNHDEVKIVEGKVILDKVSKGVGMSTIEASLKSMLEEKIDRENRLSPAGKKLLKEKFFGNGEEDIEFSLEEAKVNLDFIFDLLDKVEVKKVDSMPAQSQVLEDSDPYKAALNNITMKGNK